MKKTIFVFVALASFLNTAYAAQMTPPKLGRIVVFGDKKEGVFKSDLSIKVGTGNDLKTLKLAESQKGVHACFVGDKNSIKPIFDNMIASANTVATDDGLTIKSLETSKNASIQVEVISHDSKTYLQLNLGPC
jgi:hypothetical protein